jgi:hypothetical protein
MKNGGEMSHAGKGLIIMPSREVLTIVTTPGQVMSCIMRPVWR